MDGEYPAYPEGVVLAEDCNKVVDGIGGRGSAFACYDFVAGDRGGDFRSCRRYDRVVAG